MFDEQPDGDPHGECAAEIHRMHCELQFVRDLLWAEHPECCGNPVVGAEYMGQQEQVCCGCPEPALLNDAQIVASLRARFPEVIPQANLASKLNPPQSAAEQVCPACKGSGEGQTVMVGDVDQPSACAKCGGRGTEIDHNGVVLVPREPTRAMVNAGRLTLKGAADFPEGEQARCVYESMIAAAP